MRSPSSPSDAVVIVGGGFGGLFTALALQRRQPNCPIVLIEPRDRFLFQPLLYELLSDELQTWEVAPRYDQLLNNNICWIQGPFRAGTWQDKVIFTRPGGLEHVLENCGEKTVADNIYVKSRDVD